MTAAENEQTIDDLRAAAHEVRTSGWTRGALETDAGQLCALGALNRVIARRAVYPSLDRMMREEEEVRRIQAAALAVTTLLPDSIEPHPAFTHSQNREMSRLINYNDFHCTGGDELALLFDQAREKLEAEL